MHQAEGTGATAACSLYSLQARGRRGGLLGRIISPPPGVAAVLHSAAGRLLAGAEGERQRLARRPGSAGVSVAHAAGGIEGVGVVRVVRGHQLVAPVPERHPRGVLPPMPAPLHPCRKGGKTLAQVQPTRALDTAELRQLQLLPYTASACARN